MKVKIGEYELLDSMSVIQIGNTPVMFTLEDSDGGDLSFKFEFSDDTSIEGSKTEIKIAEDKTLIFSVKNLNNAINGGNTSLLQVGTFKHRKLYINYRIFTFSKASTDRTIIINVYLGERVEDGQ